MTLGIEAGKGDGLSLKITPILWPSKEAEEDKAVILLLVPSLHLAPVLMWDCPSLLKKDKLGEGL